MTRPDHMPRYVDLQRLAFELSTGESTIEAWVRKGEFPQPRKVGGKRLWVWIEVERHINRTDTSPSLASSGEGIREATRRVSQGG